MNGRPLFEQRILNWLRRMSSGQSSFPNCIPATKSSPNRRLSDRTIRFKPGSLLLNVAPSLSTPDSADRAENEQATPPQCNSLISSDLC